MSKRLFLSSCQCYMVYAQFFMTTIALQLYSPYDSVVNTQSKFLQVSFHHIMTVVHPLLGQITSDVSQIFRMLCKVSAAQKLKFKWQANYMAKQVWVIFER